MTPVELIVAALALSGSVAVGTAAHELSHSIALWAGGYRCEIRWWPNRGRGWLRPRSAFASVTPQVDGTASPMALRCAALAPLTLATPLALALAGLLPDPYESGPLAVQAALIGWLGCALPSPQDFAVVWYADRALARASAGGDGAGQSADST